MKNIIVLYHRGCNDGIVAAWAAFSRFGKGAKYLAYQYGEDLPADIFGNHVIMVDLSIPVDMLSKVKSEVESLLIIDHHKTAEPLAYHMQPVKTYAEYLRHRMDGDQTFMLFDREHSGAVLAYAFFNNIETIVPAELPKPIQLIQDYDLWQHNFSDTKPLNAWLINGGLSIDRVEELMSYGDNIPAEFLAVGSALMKYDEKIIKSVLKEYIETFTMDDGTTYAMINAPHHLRNEIGDKLKDKFDFVVLYTRRKERTVYSLRARKGGFDTSTISSMFGGGGHAEASAFSIVHPDSALGYTPIRFGKQPGFLERFRASWAMLVGRTA